MAQPTADPAGTADPARQDPAWQDPAAPEEQLDQQISRALGPTRLVPRWVAWVLIVTGVAMLPWLAGLAVILPDHQQAAHYRAAWVGFDLVLCLLLLRTGWLALKGREHMELSAAMTGTLLLVDAWFDVMTAAGRTDMLTALALALFGELPMAAFCLWIAGRVEYRRQRRDTVMSDLLRRLRLGRRD